MRIVSLLALLSAVPEVLWRDVTTSVLPTTAEWTNRVALADIDGDGRVDLLFANGGNYSEEVSSHDQPPKEGLPQLDGELLQLIAADVQNPKPLQRPQLLRKPHKLIRWNLKHLHIPEHTLMGSRSFFGTSERNGESAGQTAHSSEGEPEPR